MPVLPACTCQIQGSIVHELKSFSNMVKKHCLKLTKKAKRKSIRYKIKKKGLKEIMQKILLPFPPLSATTSRPVIPMSILRNQCKFY